MLIYHSIESKKHRKFQFLTVIIRGGSAEVFFSAFPTLIMTVSASLLSHNLWPIFMFRRKILDRSTDDFISNLSCDSSDGENHDENIEVERQIFRRRLREPRHETNQPSTSENLCKQRSLQAAVPTKEKFIKKQKSEEQNQSSNVSQSNQSATRKGNWKSWF